MRGTTQTPLHLLHLLLRLVLFFSLSIADDASVMQKLAKLLSPTPLGWSGPDPCKWSNIECKSGRVVTINLNSKSLSGSLPPDLNTLSSLKTLSLQNNKLSGPLPSLADLPDLQGIFLDTNNFTSIPPKFFSGLTSLAIVTISNNPLSPWQIPLDLGKSTNLQSFMASNANIMGSIPEFFGTLPSLGSLRLSYNKLTGGLPRSFAGSAIQFLWLNNQVSPTKLTGPIDVLGEMTQLHQAWLHSNAFAGGIPDLSKCESLFDLQLRDNRLGGPLPPSIFSLSGLVNVTLGNNLLQGPFPKFGPNVLVDDKARNNFCSKKPGPCDPRVTVMLAIEEGFGSPENLAESWIGNNPCSGWSYVSCDSKGNVVVLTLGNRNLVGRISPAIANLTSLKTLILSNNNLTGPIPDGLTSLPQLQTVDVSNNNLTGKIPVFREGVKVSLSGNPFLGKDLEGDGLGLSSIFGSSSSSSFPVKYIIIIVILAVFIILGLSMLLRHHMGKAHNLDGAEIVKFKANGKNGKANDKVSSDLQSQSSSANGDFQAFEAGSMLISIQVLRQVTNNFSDDKVVGRGGFGIVYKGVLEDGTQIAVKRMEAAMISSKGMNEYQAEIAVLSKVKHRHLVGLMGYCTDGNEKLLVYEYMPQGTLGEHLFEWKENGLNPLSWKRRIAIALDVARGIEYLHTLAHKSFIHRDLKPSNILLDDDMRAKVSDFGLVKNAPDGGKYSVETKLAGTFGYLAPEYAATGRVTTKADVYSYGVILMELITGRRVLDDNQPEDRTHLVTWFRRMLINKDNIQNLVDPILNPDQETYDSILKVMELAGHCTAREPYQRPEMGHTVNILSPLVEQWKPTGPHEEDAYGIDIHVCLPDVLERWQADEGNSMTDTSMVGAAPYGRMGSFDTQNSMPSKPTGLDKFGSMDCR